ncbi:hypothetical protein GCM10020331_039150 [Ectobacillus funiculus]
MGCTTSHEKIQERYPTAEFHKEICLATQVRQEAVADQAKRSRPNSCRRRSKKSNNSNRLAQVSMEIAGTNAYRISDVSKNSTRVA